jgi:hypothetical protein
VVINIKHDVVQAAVFRFSICKFREPCLPVVVEPSHKFRCFADSDTQPFCQSSITLIAWCEYADMNDAGGIGKAQAATTLYNDRVAQTSEVISNCVKSVAILAGAYLIWQIPLR